MLQLKLDLNKATHPKKNPIHYEVKKYQWETVKQQMKYMLYLKLNLNNVLPSYVL